MPFVSTPVIQIVTPYPEVEWIPIWAVSENQVDFDRDPEAACRTTLCFAATELQSFLQRSFPETPIEFAAQPSAQAFTIELSLEGSGDAQEFSLIPHIPKDDSEGAGLTIRGKGRTGVLYGAYEFLRLQGWRWFEPGIEGEEVPVSADSLIIPEDSEHYKPDYHGGRGFDLQALAMDSVKLLYWMARNRMDTASYRPQTAALARKLGFQFKNGGHIFEAMMDPDRRMPSGKTLWEEHPEWYGLPENGQRTKENALKIQFCVSQPDLLDLLAEEMAEGLRFQWKEVDILAVWGFDTWGEVCHCPSCQEKGNDSDRMLYFAGQLRERLNQQKDGVGKRVRFASCSYEGTVTLDPPTRPIPEALIEARDRVICYPIDRSYASPFWDSPDPRNQRYAQALDGWLVHGGDHEVTIGEYYNVSKYEDLPLVFINQIRKDIPDHHRKGITGITYMHPPLINWGTRALTHTLMAALAWNTSTDVDQLLEEYFQLRYGPYAKDVHQSYQKLESAWKYIAEWRAWHGSVLRQLIAWDGQQPSSPLDCRDSFGTPENALADADRALPLMEEALHSIEECLRVEQNRYQPPQTAPEAVNPLIARDFEARTDLYSKRLAEYRRHFTYGLLTMQLMSGCLRYHHALFQEDTAEAERSWVLIEKSADQLDQLWIPLSYEYPGPDILVKDGLSRSQLRVLVRHLRHRRQE